VTYLHPPFFGSPVGAAFIRALGQVGTLRMLGSGTMDSMAIAGGQWDVLVQHTVADWDRLPGAAIVRGAGGASVVVPAAGVDWTVTGAPAAVADVRAALLDR
jgi:myo-inositol-1(or 4)-monophosphatase